MIQLPQSSTKRERANTSMATLGQSILAHSIECACTIVKEFHSCYRVDHPFFVVAWFLDYTLLEEILRK